MTKLSQNIVKIIMGRKTVLTILISILAIWICVVNNIKVDFSQGVSLKFQDIRWIYIFIFVEFILYLFLYRLDWRKFDFKNFRAREINDRVCAFIKNNSKQILKYFVTVVACVGVACVIEFILSKDKEYFNEFQLFLILTALLIVVVGVLSRKYIWKYAHVFYFFVVMSVGTVAIVSVAPAHVSWDEETHYTRTAYMSWGAKGYISEADSMMGSLSPISYDIDGFKKDRREEWTTLINSFGQDNLVPCEKQLNFSAIAYVPASISLYIGRKIGLSFVTNYMLGKEVNLFLYSLFLSLSIKYLKERGKMIVATIGLIPTSLFLVVCYSYDWWVTSLTILGISLFVGEIQSNGVINTRKVALAVFILFLGMLPKPVYLPLLFPLMLLNKKRYENSRLSRVIVVLGMIALLASFMLPILLFGAGEGDFRGGADVNSAEQIKFILSNMLEYAKILLNFIWTYLSPDQAAQYLSFFAYLGFIKYTSVVMIVLAVVTIVDNSDKCTLAENTVFIKVGNLVGVVGAIVLVATSMYVSFTPVGLDTINGCQPRYLIPVLFPFLFFSGDGSAVITEKRKTNILILSVVIMSLIFLVGWNDLVVSQY